MAADRCWPASLPPSARRRGDAGGGHGGGGPGRGHHAVGRTRVRGAAHGPQRGRSAVGVPTGTPVGTARRTALRCGGRQVPRPVAHACGGSRHRRVVARRPQHRRAPVGPLAAPRALDTRPSLAGRRDGRRDGRGPRRLATTVRRAAAAGVRRRSQRAAVVDHRARRRRFLSAQRCRGGGGVPGRPRRRFRRCWVFPRPSCCRRWRSVSCICTVCRTVPWGW